MKQAPPALLLPRLLKLNALLRKTVFSKKFYLEICAKVLDSSASVDQNLYFICYFSLLVSSILTNKRQIQQFLRSQTGNLLAVLGLVQRKEGKGTILSKKEEHEPVREKEIEEEEATEKTIEKDTAAKVAVHLNNISSYIADVRIFNRLTDSIKYMPWIIDEFSALVGPLPLAKSDRLINLIQALNCLVLELLENLGWLTDHNWIGTSDNTWWCIEAYIWSSRVWGAYLVIEILELLRRTPRAKWNSAWRINLFKQVIQLPLVVHWSLYDGCLSPFWVGLCGSGASWWGFRDMWRSLELN